MTRALNMLGGVLIVATVFGFGSEIDASSRAFFNGMSMAMPIGFILSAWFRWQRFRPYLVRIAEMEKADWLLRLMGERR